MKSTTGFKRSLGRIRRHWRAGHYDRALTEVTRLREQWPDNPQLLIMWANLVQLQNEEAGPTPDEAEAAFREASPTLDEAQAALRRAIELDEESPAAWMECGHFLDAVADDAPAASKCFAQAIVLCKRFLKEALLSQSRVFSELEQPSEALACLAEAYWLQAQNGQRARNSLDAEILERLHDLAPVERTQAIQKRVQEMQETKKKIDHSR